MSLPRLAVYIDESGQRGHSPRSSRCFLMSAVMIPEHQESEAEQWLAELKTRLGRRPTDTLHFQNLKKHGQRLAAAQALGALASLTISTVVVCKEFLPQIPVLIDDESYLLTIRYLLERVSWYARDNGFIADYTLAHIVRFPKAKLAAYETRLKKTPGCQIAWDHLDPRGGRINQPSRIPMLQVADLAVSSTAQAFEPDAYGNVEPRYLRELLPRYYTRGTGTSRLTSYGLKMHPWNDTVRAAHPWVAAL